MSSVLVLRTPTSARVTVVVADVYDSVSVPISVVSPRGGVGARRRRRGHAHPRRKDTRTPSLTDPDVNEPDPTGETTEIKHAKKV